MIEMTCSECFSQPSHKFCIPYEDWQAEGDKGFCCYEKENAKKSSSATGVRLLAVDPNHYNYYPCGSLP